MQASHPEAPGQEYVNMLCVHAQPPVPVRQWSCFLSSQRPLGSLTSSVITQHLRGDRRQFQHAVVLSTKVQQSTARLAWLVGHTVGQQPCCLPTYRA